MESIELKATRRNVIGKQVRALRREGKLPGVIYGRHIDAMAILMDLRDTSRGLAGLAPSALVTLDIDGQKYMTLIRDKQRNPISGILTHLDFLAVSSEEKLRTNVYIGLVGVAPAVDKYSAILVTGLEELDVECLPRDLPERIEVDLSGLAEIGDGLYVRDLQVSDQVRILTDPDAMIVFVTAPEMEEEEEVEEVEAEPEVLEKGKQEEEDY